MIPGPHPHGQLSQIPLPAPAAPQDKPNTGLPHTAPPVGVPPPTSEANLPGLSEAMLRVPFGVPPWIHPQGKWKVKVKFTLEQAMKALRGSRGIALLFLQHWR